MQTDFISLKNISKQYRRGNERVTIFEGLDLALDKASFVAIMGPSGSGKTTLLNLLGGLDRADSGSLSIGGATISDYSQSALSRWRASEVGFIFQFYHLLPTLSAVQNVEIPLLPMAMGAKERKKRAALALSLVGLSDRAAHRPSELSGGQQQRVAIARSLVANAPLLLCDEPTGDLDRDAADQILTLLQLLNEAHGKTILMVTHDEEAASAAKRTLRLNKGVFQSDASVS